MVVSLANVHDLQGHRHGQGRQEKGALHPSLSLPKLRLRELTRQTRSSPFWQSVYSTKYTWEQKTMMRTSSKSGPRMCFYGHRPTYLRTLYVRLNKPPEMPQKGIPYPTKYKGQWFLG